MPQSAHPHLQVPSASYSMVLVGNSGVGKTSCLNRFCKGTFRESVSSTIGQDSCSKRVDLDGVTIDLTLWDTGGQERFRSLTASFYRHTQGIVLMFDMTNQKSFDDLAAWYRDIMDNAPAGATIILMGNKLDLAEGRVIQHKLAEEFCRGYKLAYFETSAKSGEGVESGFLSLARSIHYARMQKSLSPSLSVSQKEGGQVEDIIGQSEPRPSECAAKCPT